MNDHKNDGRALLEVRGGPIGAWDRSFRRVARMPATPNVHEGMMMRSEEDAQRRLRLPRGFESGAAARQPHGWPPPEVCDEGGDVRRWRCADRRNDPPAARGLGQLQLPRGRLGAAAWRPRQVDATRRCPQ